MAKDGKTKVETTIAAAVAPLLEHNGYEIVVVEYLPGARILRLFIDHPNGVSLADCSQVSRLVSDLLDGEGYSELFSGRFTLEVSSPGLDRPLVTPKHFQRFVGKVAQVKTREQGVGRRRYQGVIKAADERQIVLDVDGQELALTYAMIEAARLVPDL